MSGYRPCILPTESPPSLDDGRDASDSFPSASPSTPSDDGENPCPPFPEDSGYDTRPPAHKLDLSVSHRRDDDNTDDSNSDNDSPKPNVPEVACTKTDTTSSKLVSTLTLTDDHPLMGPPSPDSPPRGGGYPDIVLQSCQDPIAGSNYLSNRSAVMSLSSTEEESLNRSLANGDLSLHSESFPNRCQRNTSKNNLYFSENFVGSECPKSVEGNVRVDVPEKKLIVPNVKGPHYLPDDQSNAFFSSVESTSSSIQSTDLLNSHQYKITTKSKLQLELSSNVPNAPDEYPSPDSSSASKPDNERSLYHAEVDPYGGCVVLKPKCTAPGIVPKRKRIKPLPLETDNDSTIFVSCRNQLSGSGSSLDSLSDCSLQFDGDNENLDYNHRSVVLNKMDSLNDCSDTETETEGGYRNGLSKGNLQDIQKIPEYSLSEERRDARLWLKVTLPNGEQKTIDMKVIEPYKRVLSHGGYALSGRRDAIVVFSACYLPDSSRVDYNYVMDNLFLYVLTTLEQLVTDDYILIYLHGSASKRSMPTFHWLKKCYQLIDRRLRKSLKHLYLVHPTFWLKSIMWMTKPFISSKFSRKLSYVYNLDELENLVPVEQAAIPEKVRRYDSLRS